MVWGGGLIGNQCAIGAIDFAGGTAVHISSGVSGLIIALMLGKRRDFGSGTYHPHDVPAVMLGCGLLFAGWFGFNGGSALAADGYAGLAVLNTLVCGCAGGVVWSIVEGAKTGKPSLTGISTGIIVGLVAITPACGYVNPLLAVVFGVITTPICYFFITTLKYRLGWDDALDAFGCHGVGGTVGCLLTGLFALPSLSPTGVGGLLVTGNPRLFVSQLLAVLFTIVFAGGLSAVIGLIAKVACGGSLRVDDEVEAQGLDEPVHGESAYPAFDGQD